MIRFLVLLMIFSQLAMANDYLDVPSRDFTVDDAQCKAEGMAEIDVLFVYEPEFAGTIDQLSDEWVSEINLIYQSSGVKLKMYKAGTVKRFIKADNFYGKLHRLRGDKQIEKLRDYLEADFVVGVVSKSEGDKANVVGLAYKGIRPQFAYSIVRGRVSARTVAHELGHNMGLGHGELQKSDGTLYPWGRGYGIPGKYATVMGYSQLYPAPSVLRFSNPDIDCNGVPCGVSETREDGANSALAINCVRFLVSSFR